MSQHGDTLLRQRYRTSDSATGLDEVFDSSSTLESKSNHAKLDRPGDKCSLSKALVALRVLNVSAGLVLMVTVSLAHAVYLAVLHENDLWFSHIKTVEREISFRTEAGLYYSYYKQLLAAPSIAVGVNDLMHDNVTEHGRTINVWRRFNVHQEILLAALYRGLDPQVEPVYFYLYSVFGLQALLVTSIYCISWLLSRSWVAACFTAALYSLNRVDTTRVEYTAPLRESFALPFLWAQLFCITYYLMRTQNQSQWKQNLCLCVMGLAQFAFALFWQFAQYILLLQALGLFAAAMLDVISSRELWSLYRIKFSVLVLVSLIQFGNKMVLTSLVMAFLPVSFLVLSIKAEQTTVGVVNQGQMMLLYMLLTVLLTSLVNRIVRLVASDRSDSHIFQFVLHKLGFRNIRNFDVMLYACAGAFDWLPLSIYQRLIGRWLLPLYVVAHVTLLVVLMRYIYNLWSKDGRQERTVVTTSIMTDQPELAFHTITSVLFALMGLSTMRFKYLWTVYMCIFAAYGVSSHHLWRWLLRYWRIDGAALETVRHGVTAILLCGLLLNRFAEVRNELNDLREFYDPDTVELMNWINTKTDPQAAFSGSMQLMAGVKLCTGRPLTNHPHFEDWELRERTKQLYSYYGRTPARQMYDILVRYNASYIIMEDSICLAQSNGCRLPDLIDINRGQVPDNGVNEPGQLQVSPVPRFCHEVRYGKPDYRRYFTLVFSNRTFRVYRVRPPK